MGSSGIDCEVGERASIGSQVPQATKGCYNSLRDAAHGQAAEFLQRDPVRRW